MSEEFAGASTAALASLRELIEQRFDSLDRESVLRQEALTMATTTLNQRLDGMNEFREQLRQQEITYLRKAEFQPAHDGLSDRISSLERLMYIGAGAAMIVNAVFLYFMKHP
jgi:hypothetical protein